MTKLSTTLKINPRNSVGQEFIVKPVKMNSTIRGNESKADRVTLSEPSKEKSPTTERGIVSEMRTDLIKKYRKILADGTYQIKSEELADKIVQKVKENKNTVLL